jgi:hypothetical protein
VGSGKIETKVESWATLLDSAKEDPALAERVSSLVEEASGFLGTPLIKRPYKLADIGRHRTWMDGRANFLEEEIQETFALAMSDFGACNTLTQELPILAAAYRLTGDEVFLKRTLEQLEEMATWSPLQRPGWTLYTPGNRLPEDGKDGNWLATGTGIRAIADSLEILPEKSIPPDLRDRLDHLLEKEIASIVDDWETQRSWFIRTDNPVTNQWVLPTEGLVRACLVLGKSQHLEAYSLGVKNLMRALDAHGERGEFEEGFGYASFTVSSLLHASHAMAVAGDRSAMDHPFLANFPTWLVHHFQPGDFIINCFDAGGAYQAAERTRPLLSLLAVCTGSPVARWALANQLEGPSADLSGLAAAAMPSISEMAVPPLFAQYERATRVNWRSGWEDDASGVWVRGGHSTDQHDHQDRGHVNFIHRGRPILIEAGTPSYHHPLMMTHYSSGVGHNVLQLGTFIPDRNLNSGVSRDFPGWQRVGCVAPLDVQRLEDSDGVVVVDGAGCYDPLQTWRRRVEWTPDRLEIVDSAALTSSATPEILLFRWHLGTEEEVEISEASRGGRVLWKDAEMIFSSDRNLTIEQIRLPDHTLPGHDGSEDPKNFHTCIVVKSADPTLSFELKTEVIPSPE